MNNLDLSQKTRTVQANFSTDELKRLEKIIEQQNEKIDKIYKLTKKTKNYILWGRIMSLIYILIIIIPIVLAVIYLPPYMEKMLAPYEELLGVGQKGNSLLDRVQNLQNSNNVDLESLLNIYK